MKLTEILIPACVRVPLQASAKVAAITELVDLLADQGQVSDRDAVLKATLERETTRSTGIGHGFAVPHCKSGACIKLVAAFGKPGSPIDFESLDGLPVSFIVLMVSPLDQTGPHIQALARISRLMLNEQFRTELTSAATTDDVLRIIGQYES